MNIEEKIVNVAYENCLNILEIYRKYKKYELHCQKATIKIKELERMIIDIKMEIHTRKRDQKEYHNKYCSYNKKLLKLKKSIDYEACEYSSNKIQQNKQSVNDKLQDNNDFFGKVIQINDKIDYIKTEIEKLKNSINDNSLKLKECDEILKVYQHKLFVLNQYIKYLIKKMKKLKICTIKSTNNLSEFYIGTFDGKVLEQKSEHVKTKNKSNK